jgi:hypothetical protein
VAYRDIIARYGTWAAQSDNAGGLDYNGQPTIRAKAELASREAGGIMFWEISQDTRDDTSLMKEIWSVVGSKVGSGGSSGDSGSGSGGSSGHACFFDYTYYGGASFCSSGSQSSMQSGWNDRISSLKVASGYQVEIYEHNNYGGRKVVLSGNVGSLSSRSFSNTISSFKVVSATGGGSTYPDWQAGHSYRTGDIVRYNGSLYIAEHDNPGYDPLISTWFWDPYSGGTGGSGTGGSTGGDTGGGSSGDTTGDCPAWAEGKTWYRGTKVSYQGGLYQALVTHTAWVGANWNPASTPTLWAKTTSSCP